MASNIVYRLAYAEVGEGAELKAGFNGLSNGFIGFYEDNGMGWDSFYVDGVQTPVLPEAVFGVHIGDNTTCELTLDESYWEIAMDSMLFHDGILGPDYNDIDIDFFGNLTIVDENDPN